MNYSKRMKVAYGTYKRFHYQSYIVLQVCATTTVIVDKFSLRLIFLHDVNSFWLPIYFVYFREMSMILELKI